MTMRKRKTMRIITSHKGGVCAGSRKEAKIFLDRKHIQ